MLYTCILGQDLNLKLVGIYLRILQVETSSFRRLRVAMFGLYK